jgi:uncharacterized protein (DUF2132 family)
MPHQPTDPLHGVTLHAALDVLVARFGWEGLAERVPVRCFQHEPSIPSSLKFLRKTPWARAKVEALYVEVARKQKRNQRRAARREHGAAIAVGDPEEPGDPATDEHD